MGLVWKEEHRMLRDTVRQFVMREILPYIENWEESGSFPRELYQKAGKLGLLGIGFPEAEGGVGNDPLMVVAFTEEIMRCTSAGLVASLGSLGIGLPPFLAGGDPDLKMQWVPRLFAGDKVMALAITEPGGGSDVANLQTRARRTAHGYVISGNKTFITSGCRADCFTMAVRTGGDGFAGISLMFVEADRPGFQRSAPLKKMGWWASDTAELFLESVEVPADHLIGPENSGFMGIMANFQMERLNLAVMAIMTATMAYEACLSYVQQRQAFGRKIAQFQVIRHKLVEMAMRIEVGQQYIYHVVERMQQGQSLIHEVSMAKNFATQVSDFVTHEAVQIFAGSGYMRGSLVERLYRDNRILSIGGGTYEIMNEIIARQILS